MEAAFRTALLVFVFRVAHISAVNAPTYFRADGPLDLSPAAVPDHMTNILWRHNGNYVAEWIKGTVTYYGEFDKRTELNLNTGHLRINKATAADNGVFTVEINNALQEDGFDVLVIRVVPDPHVWVKPGPKPDTYLLYCEPAPDQGAGFLPVSYRWKIGAADWVELGNKVEIRVNETTVHAETFTCQMVNPVSEKTSKPEKNPFYRPDPEPGPVGVVVGAVVGVAGLLAGVGLFILYKKNKFPFSRSGNEPVSPSEDKRETVKLEPTPE